MTNLKPAEVFAPGEFIKDFLEDRGWDQSELAEIMGRTEAEISNIVNGKMAITTQTAKQLAAVFGTSAEVWLNLETAYRLHHDKTEAATVERKARIHSYAPVKEMIKRGWLRPTDNLDVLEQQVLDHFGVKSLDEEPALLAHAARKSTSYGLTNHAQMAWLIRAKHLAAMVPAERFSPVRMSKLLSELKPLMANVEDTRLVPQTLAKHGIRFVLLEYLPGTKIDGAAFWLSENQPVVVISGRYDKVDAFWFTLMHELAHIETGDGQVTLDVDLVGEKPVDDSQLPESEIQANTIASDRLINKDALWDFILRKSPLYSVDDIRGFARIVEVHPGVVLGQLQHRRQLPWSRYKHLLAPVRKHVAQSAMVDGWGYTVGD